MDHGIIERKNLGAFLDALTQTCRVYGPVEHEGGVELLPLKSGADVTLAYANVIQPLKRLFLPQSEVLYTYDAETNPTPVMPDERFIVFGARPCDVNGLVQLDRVYQGMDPKDPHFARRRENGLIVSLACRNPCRTCFCASVGGSPSDRTGTDVLAVDIEDVLVLEACSEKGKTWLKDASTFIRPAEKKHLEAAEAAKKVAHVKVPHVKTERVTEKLVERYDADIWAEVADTCLSCGTCTFLCPSCQCFGVFDEPCAEGRKRFRCWDACMFALYSLEASGHNPRGAPAQRMRQRVMHKFRYTVENFDRVSCVGCGRCVMKCPVNIDIRETIAKVIQ